MINTTDLNECELLLPGDWQRQDNGDIYSFTVDKMELRDERLFKQLVVRHAADASKGENVESFPYALTIKGDYCGIMVGTEEFVIQAIGRGKDGVVYMEWQAEEGSVVIQFTSLVTA